MRPDTPLASLPRLTTQQKAALKRLGLITLRDLLYHFPVRHESPGSSQNVAGLVSGEKVTLYGRITKVEAKKLWKSRRAAAEGWFEDGTGKIKILWFNQPYLAKMTPLLTPVKVTGTVSGKDKPYLTNPEVVPLSGSAVPNPLFHPEPDEMNGLFPVYPETSGITSRWMYHTLKKYFENPEREPLLDPIPESVRTQYHLPDINTALLLIHAPKVQKDAEAARKRFAFEEIFALQVATQKEKVENAREQSYAVSVDPSRLAPFIKSLPYPLTDAQERAIKEICADMERGYPMARLLEGDVGSGKTAVAAATSYAVVTSRPTNQNFGTLQVAYMAPTEILATQHFHSFIEYFKELPIAIALITGSGCYKYPSKVTRDKPTKISRTQLLKWVANGEIAMVVGTHALIQKSVVFKHLAYAIVDEQHRFGTKQRKALVRRQSTAEAAPKSVSIPHFLSMTATPIPRTLALTIYGDLDLSVLDELPKNRASIDTKIVKANERETAYTIVRKQLDEGRQAYVICPRIDEPDPDKEFALRVKSVKEEAARLKKDIFPSYEIGMLHGKMAPQEKDRIMQDFSRGDIHVLVATSVVEVGVNIPNATMILIEGAERFGLSQLHQLRGRVLRSSHHAYCFLLPETMGRTSLERLRALEKTRDGFALAEQDLLLRGAGDLYGKSQWGVSDIGMEALKNPRLIEAARSAAEQLVRHDPTLMHHKVLAARVVANTERMHRE